MRKVLHIHDSRPRRDRGRPVSGSVGGEAGPDGLRLVSPPSATGYTLTTPSAKAAEGTKVDRLLPRSASGAVRLEGAS